jgi:D-glycero-D-manno-heptose 1,7-bisphosphate phosphatase
MEKNKALFLDRDGVVNHDPGDYTMSMDEFVILPTVIDALKLASDHGFKIIIITNQGGLAKGLYTVDDVNAMHHFLRNSCQKVGVEITGIYYSPHHPDFGNSLSRKPGSLLMERAIAKHHIDPLQSIMIGDRQRDMDCAAAVGVRGILIPTNADLIHFVRTLIA